MNEKCFDLSIDDLIKKIDLIKNRYDFIVIGTNDDINSCLNYINNCQNVDVIGCDIDKNDIFEYKDGRFVNCTDYFKQSNVR